MECPIKEASFNPCLSMRATTSSAMDKYVCILLCGEVPWFLKSMAQTSRVNRLAKAFDSERQFCFDPLQNPSVQLKEALGNKG
jgi:hypothetical protein